MGSLQVVQRVDLGAERRQFGQLVDQRLVAEELRVVVDVVDDASLVERWKGHLVVIGSLLAEATWTEVLFLVPKSLLIGRSLRREPLLVAKLAILDVEELEVIVVVVLSRTQVLGNRRAPLKNWPSRPPPRFS